MNNVVFAFMLTALAGLSTCIGSLIAFFAKKTSKKFLSVSLGFSAGVMIYVSLIELFPMSVEFIMNTNSERKSLFLTIVSFFGGMIIMLLINKLIPDEKGVSLNVKKDGGHNKLMRTGVLSALAIAIHNFPEGLATFVSALGDSTVAIPVVVAIAIHNIPEGIAVSVPIYYATKSKKKAFLYSVLSGITEPLGAVIGYLLLMPILNDTINGILFASIAGIMVFISFDELLPTSREYGKDRDSVYGLVVGMLVMAVSLWLFV